MSDDPSVIRAFDALERATQCLPLDRRADSLSIVRQLRGMRQYLGEYVADCLLFDWTSQEMRRFPPIPEFELRRAWKLVACRDAAMNVYHFGNALDALLKRYFTSAWKDKADSAVLRTLQPEFEREFPGWALIRNAVGHRAQLYKSPAEAQRHTTPGNLWYQENIINRTFQMTWEGTVVSCELSPEKSRKLEEIFINALRAFEPILAASASGPTAAA